VLFGRAGVRSSFQRLGGLGHVVFLVLPLESLAWL
jgi:hypothetical protein